MNEEDKEIQDIITKLLNLRDNHLSGKYSVHCLYDDLEEVFKAGMEYQKNQKEKSPLDALFG